MKSFSSRTFLFEFWEERGEKLMTCHLFLDNFFWNFMTFGWFSKVESFETDFCFRKLKYLNLDIMKYPSFLNFVFRQRHFITENWLCFRACNSRIVTYDQEFCHVVWFLCFNHYYGIFFFKKFSFKRRYHDFLKCLGSKSWCCRKHVFVFEIVSLKGLNNFDQIIFSLWLFG